MGPCLVHQQRLFGYPLIPLCLDLAVNLILTTVAYAREAVPQWHCAFLMQCHHRAWRATPYE